MVYFTVAMGLIIALIFGIIWSFSTSSQKPIDISNDRMPFNVFVEWCNERASDGCWDMHTAIACADVIRIVRAQPRSKREKYWHDKYERWVIPNIVKPLDEMRKELYS